MPKNMIVKKGKRYYNKITKKYVSESYAKRLKGYFKKHPETTLYRAGGHGVYDIKEDLSKHAMDIKKLSYQKGTQVIKTKTIQGKKVYYSPIHNEILTDKSIKDLKDLDYYIYNKKMLVELFRMTRMRENIYHIITWNIDQRITSIDAFDVWIMYKGLNGYNRAIKEIKKIVTLYRFSNVSLLYATIGVYFISKLDNWESGNTFGFVIPDKRGYEIMKEGYLKSLDHWKRKIDIDKYHDIILTKICFCLYDSVRRADKKAVEIAKYRIGVQRFFT